LKWNATILLNSINLGCNRPWSKKTNSNSKYNSYNNN